jgi:hypothetical protein
LEPVFAFFWRFSGDPVPHPEKKAGSHADKYRIIPDYLRMRPGAHPHSIRKEPQVRRR